MNVNDVALTMRQAVGDHLGHSQEMGRLQKELQRQKLLFDSSAAASNLVTIQSTDGDKNLRHWNASDNSKLLHGTSTVSLNFLSFFMQWCIILGTVLTKTY